MGPKIKRSLCCELNLQLPVREAFDRAQQLAKEEGVEVKLSSSGSILRQ